MQKILFSFTVAFFFFSVGFFSAAGQTLSAQGSAYTVTPDAVIQKPYRGQAVSATEIRSDYRSPAKEFVTPRIDFKFSINGKDNEMPSGKDHHLNCIARSGVCETPLIRFGSQLNDESEIPSGVYLGSETKFRIRLDMRDVFAQFSEKGFYTTWNGTKIYEDDFKGVYVAGGTPPLTWDFDNLHNYKNLQLHDHDGDRIYELELAMNPVNDAKATAPVWKLSKDISAYPAYTSSYTIADALYNLALEEMINAVEKDSTLRTGKEWAGVWTRDVSYSIILSMAILQPKVAMYSLMRKVKNGMIIQDTGTGGAYPVSTDRMIWATAAYEIYKVTGDEKWLATIYPIIKKSLEYDLMNAMDPVTGMVRGESSFLDWREQTYPDWMQPADIFESECLGTNAVHFQAHTVLAAIAKKMSDAKTSARHEKVAEGIRQGMNRYLWMKDSGYYAQYVYGRNYKIVSPRSEALGGALSVLFGIAGENAGTVVSRTPVNAFGIPCIYPQIPGIPPYHNNAVWPFVQSYWTLAAAKAGNEKSVTESLNAIYRPAALFLTNKENFVASSGDYASTQVNSDNMLWSLSGQIAMVYRLFFGISYHENGIKLSPFVPRAYQGKRTLSNYRFRNAILDFEMEGSGSTIQSITMDGKPLDKAFIPASLSGKHSIKIVLTNNLPAGSYNLVPHYTTLPAPEVRCESTTLSWPPVSGAVRYRVISNGREVSSQKENTFAITNRNFAEYQVIAADNRGIESFASEPVFYFGAVRPGIMEMENHVKPSDRPYKGFSGKGFVFTSVSENQRISFPVSVDAEGTYAIDFRYSNGNGPVNTENKCAIRSLHIGGAHAGTFVFPQRGTNEWSEWGFSNSVTVKLRKGTTVLTLVYLPYNENMNGEVNEAMLDYVRIIPLPKG